VGLSERLRLRLVPVIALMAIVSSIAYVTTSHTTLVTSIFVVSLITEIGLALSLSITKGICEEDEEHEHDHDAF
jgi:uncharacterized protein YqhQ